MNAAKPSAHDEAQIMELLLAGIDASIFEGAPSPDPTPKKRKSMGTRGPAKSPEKPKSSKPPSKKSKDKENAVQEEDIAALLEGAESWDWDDFLTPPRKKAKVCQPSDEDNTVEAHIADRKRS